MAKRAQEKIYDRMTADLPINARVAIAIVQDPYAAGEKIKVLRSTRDDPLAGLHAREQIKDHQLAAGRKLQEYFEGGQIGYIKAIDPTKEAVDGGRIPEPITDKQIKALRRLDEVHKWIGNDSYAMLYTVLGKRMTLKDAAAYHGYVTAREIDYFARRIKDSLESLAVLWGLAVRDDNRI